MGSASIAICKVFRPSIAIILEQEYIKRGKRVSNAVYTAC